MTVADEGSTRFARLRRLLGGSRSRADGLIARRFQNAVALATAIQSHHSPAAASGTEAGETAGRQVFELGAGRNFAIPVALWLLGISRRTMTADLSPLLDPSLVATLFQYLRKHGQRLLDQLGPALHSKENQQRLNQLLTLPARTKIDLAQQVLELCNITYIVNAPGDLSNPLKAQFDVHFSHQTLEHVRPCELGAALRNANRLLKADGVCVHLIDTSDHDSDPAAGICQVDYLRYGDEEWRERMASGVVSHYVNRLRASQYPPIFEAAGFDILEARASVDDESLRAIESKRLPLAARFRDMAASDLATTSLLLVATPARGN